MPSLEGERQRLASCITRIRDYERQHGSISPEMEDLKDYYLQEYQKVSHALPLELKAQFVYQNPDIDPTTGEEYPDLI